MSYISGLNCPVCNSHEGGPGRPCSYTCALAYEGLEVCPDGHEYDETLPHCPECTAEAYEAVSSDIAGQLRTEATVQSTIQVINQARLELARRYGQRGTLAQVKVACEMLEKLSCWDVAP